MNSHEVKSGPQHEGGQAFHEFQRRHDDVSGTIPVRAFELQHDITGAVDFSRSLAMAGRVL